MLEGIISNHGIDMKFVLLHEAKNDDGIKSFFYDIWELYLKVSFRSAHCRACDPSVSNIHFAIDNDESFSYRSYSHPEFDLRQSSASQCEEVLVEVNSYWNPTYTAHWISSM